jgi:hypothetical protein
MPFEVKPVPISSRATASEREQIRASVAAERKSRWQEVSSPVTDYINKWLSSLKTRAKGITFEISVDDDVYLLKKDGSVLWKSPLPNIGRPEHLLTSICKHLWQPS